MRAGRHGVDPRGCLLNGTGAMPCTTGRTFVRHGDVVVVSINYRLGALGWLESATSTRTTTVGNNGLLDQIAPSRWVHDNIDGFGGRPRQRHHLRGVGRRHERRHPARYPGRRQVCSPRPSPKWRRPQRVVDGERHRGHRSVPEGAGRRGLEAVATAEPARLLEAQQAVSQAMVSGHIQRPVTSASGLPFGPVIDGAVLPAIRQRPSVMVLADSSLC